MVFGLIPTKVIKAESRGGEAPSGRFLGNSHRWKLAILLFGLSIAARLAAEPESVSSSGSSAVFNPSQRIVQPAGATAKAALADEFRRIDKSGSKGGGDPKSPKNDFKRPAVRLTSPSPGAVYSLGDPIVLSAKAAGIRGKKREIQFFAGSQLLGSAPLTHPTLVWTASGLGTHDLTATVINRRGVSYTSKPVRITVRPTNDDFTNRYMLHGLSVVTNGNVLGASKEHGESTGGAPSADASVWYLWIAPADGITVVSIQGGSFAAHPLGVYAGDAVSNLVSVGESIYDFIPVSFMARAGVAYQIQVNGFSASPPEDAGTFILSLNQAPAPLNDDFSNSAPLSGTVATVTGSNRSATREPGEPEHSYTSIDNSIWWTWTAPSKGRLSLNFLGSDFAPVASLYSGNTVSNLSLVGRAYTSFDVGVPVADFDVQAGQTYHIALVGFWFPVIEGDLVMGLTFSDGPPNDNFADRIPLLGSVATAAGSNTTATAETGEPDSNGRTVWWTWTADTTGPVSIGSQGSSFNPWLSVYTGTELTNLALVTSGLGRLTFNAVRGTEYQISADANRGPQVGELRLALAAGPSANDNFSDRSLLSGTNVSTIGATTGATREALEPVHGYYQGSSSVWWTWSAPAKGTLTITVTGDGISPTWAVYSGSSISELTLLGDSYDWMWGVRPSASMAVEQGIPLQIAVDGSADSGDAARGIFKLELSFIPLPLNDDFLSRVPLAGSFVHATGNSSGATRELGEPDHGGFPGGHSLWWSWVAPASGQVTLDASGSAHMTLAAVYTGSNVSGLSEVVSGNASFSPLNFECEEGVTYQIATDYWFSDFFGVVDLKLLFSSLRLTSFTNEEVFYAPTEILVAATNGPWDGAFDQMEFLVGGELIGVSTNVPYSFTWENPPLGDHYIQARVKDSNGITRVSPGVLIHNRPANDNFANRAPVPAEGTLLHAAGIGSILESDEPEHGPLNSGSVWWSWTAPSAGRVSISKPSELEFRFVLLAVYTGSALAELQMITNTPANLSGTLTATVAFDVQPGTTYQIAVAGNLWEFSDVPVAFSFMPSSDPAPEIQQPTNSPGEVVAIQNPRRDSTTQFSFVLRGEPGSRYSVLASTNLALPLADWVTVLTTNVSGSFTIIQDNHATVTRRFYRVRIEQ